MSTVVARLSLEAVMSRNTSSSAPSRSYRAASSTGSPASRRSTKLVPLTTRPSVTSRQGITRATFMQLPLARHRRPAAQPLEGRGDVEPALVQRLAGDDPAQPVDLGERDDVVEVGHAPAGDHRAGARSTDAARPTRSGPLEHAVAGDVGDDERRGRREQLVDVVEVPPAALGPAVHGQFAVTVVEPDRHRQDCADTSATSVGSRTAAEPITTRATPSLGQFDAASSTVRTPPPVCTLARRADRARRSPRPPAG